MSSIEHSQGICVRRVSRLPMGSHSLLASFYGAGDNCLWCAVVSFYQNKNLNLLHGARWQSVGE